MVGRNHAHLACLAEWIFRIPQARGLEVRPFMLRACRAERPRIGPVALRAERRGAGVNLLRQARYCNQASRSDGSADDGVSYLEHDTEPLFAVAGDFLFISRLCAIFGSGSSDRISSSQAGVTICDNSLEKRGIHLLAVTIRYSPGSSAVTTKVDRDTRRALR